MHKKLVKFVFIFPELKPLAILLSKLPHAESLQYAKHLLGRSRLFIFTYQHSRRALYVSVF